MRGGVFSWVFGVNYFCRSCCLILRMLPAILRMIVPAVSDESRAGGTHGQEPAARRFTLDRKHAAARGVLRSRVRQSAASRESSWTAGTPPSRRAARPITGYRSRGAGDVSPVDASLDAALPPVGHLTMHHQLHPFTRPPPAGSSRGRTGVRGVPRPLRNGADPGGPTATATIAADGDGIDPGGRRRLRGAPTDHGRWPTGTFWPASKTPCYADRK